VTPLAHRNWERLVRKLCSVDAGGILVSWRRIDVNTTKYRGSSKNDTLTLTNTRHCVDCGLPVIVFAQTQLHSGGKDFGSDG